MNADDIPLPPSDANPLAFDPPSLDSIASADPDSAQAASDPTGEAGDASVRLSYKFQRLREKLRDAISSGELSGRLPGERKLARKFRVNAKTLSKALTDLAAEGLLDRSIGRGTFVKGSADPATPAVAEKWLIICDEDQSRSTVVLNLLAANSEAQCSIGMPPQRPSFLNPFKAVVIFSRDIPEAFIRDLVVRNIAVVVADRQPGTYSTHAVLIDRSHGASIIARDLMLDGHRRLAVVEERGNTELATAVRHTAQRYAPDATIEPLDVADAHAAIEHGVTAIICDSFDAADRLRARLDELRVEITRQISLAAVGSGNGECRCSGYFVAPDQLSQTVVEILRDNNAKRPITLFLAGQSIDCGTTGPTEAMIDSAARLRYAPVSA
jgi:hypothetical protein